MAKPLSKITHSLTAIDTDINFDARVDPEAGPGGQWTPYRLSNILHQYRQGFICAVWSPEFEHRYMKRFHTSY